MKKSVYSVKSVWDLYGICIGSVSDLYRICIGSVSDLYRICIESLALMRPKAAEAVGRDRRS